MRVARNILISHYYSYIVRMLRYYTYSVDANLHFYEYNISDVYFIFPTRNKRSPLTIAHGSVAVILHRSYEFVRLVVIRFAVTFDHT